MNLVDLKKSLQFFGILVTTPVPNGVEFLGNVRVDGTLTANVFAIPIPVNRIPYGNTGGTALTSQAGMKFNPTLGNFLAGVDAGIAITTAAGSVGIGSNALRFTTTGVNNIAIGEGALRFNTTGAENVAFGNDALTTNVINDSNIAIGSQALNLNTAASNIGIGVGAGASITTGTRNIAIGDHSTITTATADDQLAIGSPSASDYFFKGNLTQVDVAPILRFNGGTKSSDGTAGATAVVNAAGLVSLTFKNGLFVSSV